MKNKPIYTTIYEDLRERILAGRLKAGEKLPGERSYAESLGVSRQTVGVAYGQLLAEGYLYVKSSSGYYVSPTENITVLQSQGREKPAEKPAQLPRKEPAEEARPDLIDFSPRSIDMTRFPYATWRRISRDLMVGDRADIFRRGDPMGDYPLREAIARYLDLARGIACTADEILIGAGNDYLLLLLGLIFGRQMNVAMENPTYRRAGEVFGSLSWQISPIGMDDAGIRLDELERSKADLVYVMPAHQYPTGILMPYGRRRGLCDWALGGERYIVEDDYDSEFRYSGRPVPALKAIDTAGKVIYIGSFSKSIAPAIRVSYMILPPDLLQAYRKRCGFVSQTVSRIDQGLLQAFLREGHFERHVNRMRKVYRDKHDLMVECLEPFAGTFSLAGMGAGHHLLLKKRGKWTWEEAEEEEKRLEEKARLGGIRVYPIGDLYAARSPEIERAPTFLLGYAALPEEAIREGTKRLFALWNSEGEGEAAEKL